MSKAFSFVNDRWPVISLEDDSEELGFADQEKELRFLANSPSYNLREDFSAHADEEPVLLASQQGTDNPGISIVCPRARQTTLAPGRDFYVVGKFTGNPDISDNAELRIKLYTRDNKLIRDIHCNKKDDKDHLYISRDRTQLFPVAIDPQAEIDKNPEKFYESVRNSCVPDLVYDSEDDEAVANNEIPKSLSYYWNKAYYTDYYFTALISGGVFYDDRAGQNVSVLDPAGQPISQLVEGDYTLFVELYDTNGTFLHTSLDIRIGFIGKYLAAFSYPDHMRALFTAEYKDKAGERTIMWDPLPGIWNCGLIEFSRNGIEFRKDGVKYRFSFWINKKRVSFNDACEYKDGPIYAVNYGIGSDSNARTVEMAEINRQNQDRKTLGKPPVKVTCYTYRYGEPTAISGIDQDSGEIGSLFEMPERVKFFRLTINGKEIAYKKGMTIEAKDKDTIYLYGACELPMDISVNPADEDGHVWDLDRMYRFTYMFYTSEGKFIRSARENVELTRYITYYEGDTEHRKKDIYQFKHYIYGHRDNNLSNETVVKLGKVEPENNSGYDTEISEDEILRIKRIR